MTEKKCVMMSHKMTINHDQLCEAEVKNLYMKTRRIEV